MTSTHAPVRLLITGASGYIGRRLTVAARSLGYEVVAAVRDRTRLAAGTAVEVREFDLRTGEGAEQAVRDVDAVVHLAAILHEDSRPAGVDEDLNVSGTRQLLDAARRCGVRRFVFLSSQSAASDSPTNYGRSKWEIEHLLSSSGECAVRTGLVSGGPPRGLYGVLLRLSRRLPLLPIVRPGAPVYPVHVDDLCSGLLSLVASDRPPPSLVRVASDESMQFGDYVRMIARTRLGRRVRLIPIPTTIILAASGLTRLVPFLPTVSNERVLGLKALRPMDPASLPAPPDAPRLRDVAESLATEGRRRRLLVEARALTGYVLGSPPARALMRRYVRAVLAEDDSEPVEIPSLAGFRPGLLRFYEPVGPAHASRLRQRLTLATRIVEMTPEAAPLFHGYRERSRVLTWLGLCGLVIVEALLLPLRWIASRRRRH